MKTYRRENVELRRRQKVAAVADEPELEATMGDQEVVVDDVLRRLPSSSDEVRQNVAVLALDVDRKGPSCWPKLQSRPGAEVREASSYFPAVESEHLYQWVS